VKTTKKSKNRDLVQNGTKNKIGPRKKYNFDFLNERLIKKLSTSLRKNGSFRWRICDLPHKNNKFYEINKIKKKHKQSKSEEKIQEKKCILFCAAHSLLSQENIASLKGKEINIIALKTSWG